MTWGAVAGAAVGVIGGALLSRKSGGGAAAGRSAELDAAATEATKQQTKIAGEQYEYWKTNFKPLEEGLVSEAKGFGSVEEQEREAGRASSTAALTMGKARSGFDRNLASYGINPAGPRFQDANLKFSLEGAKMDAAGQNLARKGVMDTAFAKKFDVVGLGKGMPASAAAGLGAAAVTNANLGANQFARSQYLQEQTRRGAAPFVSLAQQGVSRWFNSPARQGANQAPVYQPDYGIEYGSPGSSYE
jgi:hypothetical protein